MNNGTLLTPAHAEFFDCGKPVHELSDDLLFGNLNVKRALVDMAGTQAFACIIRANGQGSFQSLNEWATERYSAEKKAFMGELTLQLNIDLSEGGAWVTAWTNDRVLMMLWFDRDGDLKLTLEDDRPWSRMLPEGRDYVLSNCALALKTATGHERDLEIKPGQQIKAAQGETLH